MKTILLVIAFFMLGVFYEKRKARKQRKVLGKESHHFGYNTSPRRVSQQDKKLNYQTQDYQLSRAGRSRVEDQKIKQVVKREARYHKYDDEGLDPDFHDDKDLVAMANKSISKNNDKARKIEAVIFEDDEGYEEDDFF